MLCSLATVPRGRRPPRRCCKTGSPIFLFLARTCSRCSAGEGRFQVCGPVLVPVSALAQRELADEIGRHERHDLVHARAVRSPNNGHFGFPNPELWPGQPGHVARTFGPDSPTCGRTARTCDPDSPDCGPDSPDMWPGQPGHMARTARTVARTGHMSGPHVRAVRATCPGRPGVWAEVWAVRAHPL